MDCVTKERLEGLHPLVRDEVQRLVTEANRVTGSNITIRVVQGLRTIDEQNALYAQGRTKPGKIVTNAKGGASYHNYGLAIDFAFLVNDKEISWDTKKDWDGDKTADWLEVVQIFLRAGWVWGGNFKTIKDNPHFHKDFGLSWQKLKAKYDKKEFITGTKFVKIP